ncbi:MAG TPA: hypothetical protein VK511_12240 [Gemmatimonadaceae bacterium]|nr:hypothetical protein [Gemmatimonadaceae bacterium]
MTLASRREPRETNVEFDGDPALSGVDAICAFTGWSRRELAERLGLGEPVLRYYERDGGPRWLEGDVVRLPGRGTDRLREAVIFLAYLPKVTGKPPETRRLSCASDVIRVFQSLI